MNTKFKKGIHYSSATEFKKGIHYSSATEFKKGVHYSPTTEFKKGHNFSKEIMEKLRKSHMGHQVSIKTRKKISRALKGKPLSIATKEKLSKANLGKRLSPSTEFKKGHHGGTPFKKGHRESPEVREKRIKNILKASAVRPNQKERQLNSLLQQLLPGEYTLNVRGEVMILGGRIPDFVNVNGKKRLIELFGNYWHSEEKTGRQGKEEEAKRINHFKQFGWDTLIVWERELKDETSLKEKILEFSSEGA